VAQTNYWKQLIIKERIDNKDNQIMIDLDIVLDQLQVESNHMIVLTPIVRSVDKSRSRKLSKVVVTDSRKDRSLRRTVLLQEKSTFDDEPYIIVKRKNKAQQTIRYKVTLPTEDWMKNSQLIIEEEVTGCAFCNLAQNEHIFISQLIEEEFVPQYKTNYLTPRPEQTKARKEVTEIYLSYKLGSSVIFPDFGNNPQEIEKIINLYKTIRDNDDITITGIDIVGFASPEGFFHRNMTLSEKRARSLSDFLERRQIINPNLISIDWKGEDWDGLAKLVAASNIDDKDRVLEIIKSVDVIDGRELQLMKLEGGSIYRHMQETMFPLLRRNRFTVNVNINNFDLEKAQEMIKSDPKILSLGEMYLVANSYPKGCDVYNEIYLNAAIFFPNSPEAINNAAAIEIERGDLARAKQLLENLKNKALALNNLGVIAVQNKEYRQAKEYFTEAALNGIKEANENLLLLNNSGF
jgi:outer membrane protein OmpA-like peptidoglycan-associated protein